MSDTDCEIAICGAGPVGLALAALLVKRGVDSRNIILFDAQTAEKSSQDPRSIALSYGSQQLLQQIAAWPLSAAAIEQIHVSRRGHFGRTLIDHREHQIPALGYVTRYGQIVSALLQQCQRLGIQIKRPWQLQTISEQANEVLLQLQAPNTSDTLTIRSRILVQAEGGLFQQQNAKKRHRDYAQTAIIAEVRVDAPQVGRAFERFTDSGPLALLPLPSQADGAAYYSLVWCVTPAQAEQLQALDEAQFLSALAQAFGQRLGNFLSSSARLAFPLGLNAEPSASARCVAIGNAAQTLHPVAGQGLNLGLRDASVLARLLAQAASPSQLQQFLQERQADRNLTVRVTDTMARIFTLEAGKLPQSWLALSLGMFDMLPAARNALAQLMMFGRR